MKLNSWLPSKLQWKNWSLPSKATYIGLILGLLSFIITMISFLITEIENPIGQPQISINYTAKPYLRYSKLNSGMELSYEICFINSGNHPAINFKYKSVIQKLLINNDTIYSGHNNLKIKPPNRLVAGEKFCQIFKISNPIMSTDEINSLIKQFELNNVSIFLKINYIYEDGITGEEFSIFEKNNIKADRVEIK